MSISPHASRFSILSLDGGGSKGVYTLGVLKELETYWGEPLHKRFDLIIGTSTGAIIASLLGLGWTVDQIEKRYFALIPLVMGHASRGARSKALESQARHLFGGKTFDAFVTDVTLVATNYDAARPMLFKTDKRLAHSIHASFKPGFGCTIADAVMASTAAFPFFEKVLVHTSNQGDPLLMDGGFSANNPTLLAVADAHSALGIGLADMRVLSVGVGHYKEPSKSAMHRLLFSQWPFQMIQRMFSTNSNTIEGLRRVLFPNLVCVRIDDSYPDAQYATDLLEADPVRLRQLFVLGRESYGRHEKDILAQFPK
jgi:predicted acylesterase/phospholipase RssA